LALHAAAFGLPATILFRQLAKRRDEIRLDDCSGRAIDLIWRFSATERADQLLLGRIPFGLRSTGRAGVLLERGNFSGQTFTPPCSW
jgi:hypothetical protein